jgi:uncharacterized protein (TIGR02594 family)
VSAPAELLWLWNEPAPKLLTTARAYYGLTEVKGGKHNPTILAWAEDLGPSVKAYYTEDELPWCGLFMAHCMKKAGLDHPKGYESLRAMSYRFWGTQVSQAMLGDILVFERPGGGHVGLYVGEDGTHYHVLGGNQKDMVSVVRIEKHRCRAIRRTPWKIAQPPTVRRIFLAASGAVSTNEQ